MKSFVHHALCVPLLVGLLLANAGGQESQNGQLVDSTVIKLPDDLERLEERWPDCKSTNLGCVQLERNRWTVPTARHRRRW